MDFQQARFNMVEQQIRPWDVLNFDLLDALESIPREKFVQENQQGYAYADISLALPNGGRMLEPKIVARMIQGLSLTKTDRVLEVGTGSGYATAVLATLAGSVRTFDTDSSQQARAKAALQQLGWHGRNAAVAALFWWILPWGFALFHPRKQFLYDWLAGTELVDLRQAGE